MLVVEAVLNLACVGARPMAVVNCLNFGNPEHPEVMWQLSEAIDGMGEACRAFGIPVVGGNVSLYNESRRPRHRPDARHRRARRDRRPDSRAPRLSVPAWPLARRWCCSAPTIAASAVRAGRWPTAVGAANSPTSTWPQRSTSSSW